jgi:adenylate cyclase
VEISFLFADVRGSTALAEDMDSTEFSALMNRFYDTASSVLFEGSAFLDKFVGDEVVGIFLPAFTGENHARPAVTAARELLRATGHDDPNGPWIPIGVGVHTGSAYFGTVSGSEGVFTDLTALGDNVNVAARLAQKAGIGEALISETSAEQAGVEESLPNRSLRLKGKSRPVPVRVITTPADRARSKSRRPAKRTTTRKRKT